MSDQEKIFSGKTIEGEIYKAVGQRRETDLSEPLKLQDKCNVPAAGIGYLEQMTEVKGLQTCYPTSLLNAWVHQGILSTKEARVMQGKFRTDFAHLFGGREDIDAMVFNADPYQFARIIKTSTGKNTELLNMPVRGLERDAVAKIILQELNKGNVLIAGDAVHAVLITGYDDKGQILITRDPKTPDHISTKQTTEFTQVLLNGGETWLTIVGKI